MSKITFQLPQHLMDDVKNLSEREGVAVHAFIIALVAERVGEMKGRVFGGVKPGHLEG
jgi:hypothetical protein